MTENRKPGGKGRDYREKRASSGPADKRKDYRRERPSDESSDKRKDYRRERSSDDSSDRRKDYRGKRSSEEAPEKRRDYRERRESTDPYRKERAYGERKPARQARPSRQTREKPAEGSIRLNKYIANAGICSRREADKLIAAGAVTVNGIVVTELGTKILPTDKVQYGDQSLKREKLRYVLLNKPKGFITTTDDPQERKTVMALIDKACRERIYPVGRLDRNTTGVLLFTNDGDLAKKLIHPRHGVQKIYHVVLDKPLTKKDMMQILAGIQLDDGLIKADAVEYIGDGKDRKELGIELHSGKNRVIRRIFEKLDYKVVRLDRVSFAGLTKKNLPRGEWRHLEEKEVSFLKMIG